MGAWGHGSFDNDDSLDWLDQLTKSYHLEPLYEALVGVAESHGDYLGAPEATRALAAAEVVAAMLGNPVPKLPGEIAEWVRFAPEPPPRLVGFARQAAGRVVEASELRDLWAETEYFGAWRSEVEGLMKRLSVNPE